ncbi:unnamed protein product [Tilletia controversa]|uniref:Uncharacterized protein n=1 Tax=Tilletia controversa TaxID=13291 RepID=A0A8X7SZL6_9BASI|nr:hypothetical protein CF328_g1551 [Tilletia controversa]KAE8252738.1 hypothetical protein A4X06_0g1964 [Tilletia controversa]CAD6944029.1 unnamed protein product [Tilletia controversa]CAD6963960.1 unnamed protein product [Tilletia controversa]
MLPSNGRASSSGAQPSVARSPGEGSGAADRRDLPNGGIEKSSSATSMTTVSHCTAPTDAPEQQVPEPPNSSSAFGPPSFRTIKNAWSPSPLARQSVLEDEIYQYPQRFSQDMGSEHAAGIPIPQNFMRSFSPSNDSIHTSSSFTRSAAPIALFADDTDYSDSDAEAGPSSSYAGRLQSSTFTVPPGDALGLGFDDTDLDLSFEDSPVAARHVRRGTAPQSGAADARSPSLRHVGRLPRRELGMESGSERDSIIGLSSPETSPPPVHRSTIAQAVPSPPSQRQQQPDVNEPFYTPRVGAQASLAPEQPYPAAFGSLAERTPSAEQRRPPRTVPSAIPTGGSTRPILPLSVRKPKASLSSAAFSSAEPLSSFRSPSTRPSLLLSSSTRSISSPRSPDSAPTEAATPTIEDYDAGESGFSSTTGRQSSMFGSSSMQGGRNSSFTGASWTNSPELRPAQEATSLIPVYSDMESESEGLSGAVGLRQASLVSERWDEDFLFQEQTGDDEPASRTRPRRKGRRKETQQEQQRTTGAPVGDRSQKSREMRQPGSRGEGVSHPSGAKSSTQGKAPAGSSSRPSRLSPQQPLTRRTAENDNDSDDSDDSDGSSSGDEDEGADDTMQGRVRDIFDDDDEEEEENWDGEMSMGSSVNTSTVGGKMTASSSARTIMPATPSNLLMTGTNPRPSGHQTPTGLGSRRVTPKANKKASAALLRPLPPSGPSSFESARRVPDMRVLTSLKPGEHDGPTSATTASSSHDHDGKAGLRTSVYSQASTSSRSAGTAGTAAHLRNSMISNSTDGLGSSAGGNAENLHRKAASISASTDFSARLAAQSDVSSWHGHGTRPRPSLDRAGEVDFASVEVREDPVARQPITALVAATSAQTRERARAWVEESSREVAAGFSDIPVRKPSYKRKQSNTFHPQQSTGSAADDTETEDTNSLLRPRSSVSQNLLASSPSSPLGHARAASSVAESAGSVRPVAGRSLTQTSLSNLLSFNSKRRESDGGPSPQMTTSSSSRVRTTSRVQKLVAAEEDSRPPSRAMSSSSRSPETQRDRIKKLLVQQHKQKKEKASKLSSPAVETPPSRAEIPDPTVAERKRTRSQNSRTKLALTPSSSTADLKKPAMLAAPAESPGRSSSPFGRSWEAIRSATSSGKQKVVPDGSGGKGDANATNGQRHAGLPSRISSGTLNEVKVSRTASAQNPPVAPVQERPRHGRTGSSLSISFGLSKSKGKDKSPVQREDSSSGRKASPRTAKDGGVSTPSDRGSASKQESSHEDSPSSSPSARIITRRNKAAPSQQPSLPSAPAPTHGASLRGFDTRSTSNSTAMTNSSRLSSGDFWSRQGDASSKHEKDASQNSRRVPSGNSSNTTTPTLGSPESLRMSLGAAADTVSSLPQSRRTSASKASNASGRRQRRPSTSPELPYAELFGEPPSNTRFKSQISEVEETAASASAQQNRDGNLARPSGTSALKSSPEEPLPPGIASHVVTDESSSSKFVPRRNSLSDLKIPTRISKAQDGIRANMTYLKDFARGVGELKLLQGRYHAALLELHRHQEADGFVDSRSKDLLVKLDNVEHLYAPWWECADVLIGLGEGRGDADRNAALDTLTHSPAPAPNRNRRITLNTPPRPMPPGYGPMSKELSSDTASSLISDTSSSNMSVRRADTSSAISRASSMSGRQVAAQREMDILSLMLAGAPLDHSFANSSRDSGAKTSGPSALARSILDDGLPARESRRENEWSQSASSLTFAQPSPRPPKDEPTAPRPGPYKSLGGAAQSTASFAATSTDSFTQLNTLDPDKSGRRKLRNASRAGLQGLRELLRSFKLSSNPESESSGGFPPDSAVSTPADEPGPPPGTSVEASASFLDAMYGRPQQSKSSLLTLEGLGRPHSAQSSQPSPSRRRSKIFSLVTGGLSSSRLDVIPGRQRVISTTSSSAHSSSVIDAADNSADSGWANSENDEIEALRASGESIRASRISSPQVPSGRASGQSFSSSGGTRQRLLTLGRQLMGSRPRGDSFTSKHGISPVTLNVPLPAPEDEAMSGDAGESGFSNASSYVSDRPSSSAGSAMGPPDSSDQVTLGRRQGERLQMGAGMSGNETIRRPSGTSGTAGDSRRLSAGLRPTDSNRTSMLTRPPAYGRSFSASPSPGPSPSHSLQQIPAVPPLPSPMALEGMTARARDVGSNATVTTGSSLGGESWGSLGSDSDAGGGATTTTILTTVLGQRGGVRTVTPTMSTTQDSNETSSTSRPATVSDAAAMSRFRKMILRPDQIRSLLAYVQATKNNCDTALVEVSRLAEAMEAGKGLALSPPSLRGGGGGGGERKVVASEAQTPEEAEEEKEVLGTIRSPSAMTPKRRMVKVPAN